MYVTLILCFAATFILQGTLQREKMSGREVRDLVEELRAWTVADLSAMMTYGVRRNQVKTSVINVILHIFLTD